MRLIRITLASVLALSAVMAVSPPASGKSKPAPPTHKPTSKPAHKPTSQPSQGPKKPCPPKPTSKPSA